MAAEIRPCALETLLEEATNTRIKGSYGHRAKVDAFLNKLIVFAKTVDRFSQSIDVYIQGSGVISAIIWGSLRVVIKAIINYAQLRERMVFAMSIMAENLVRYRKYEAIFASSRPLRDSVEKVYADIYKFTIQIGAFYRRSHIRILLSNFSSTRELDLEETISDFQRHDQSCRDHALLAFFEIDQQRNQDIRQRQRHLDMHEVALWLQSDVCGTLPPKMEVFPGTLLWALPQFDLWYDSSSSNVLWIHGPAGCGKTTLLSFLESRLRHRNASGEKTCYISAYCHSKTYVSLAEILKTLLLGVLRSNVSSPELIEAILSVKRRNIEHLAVQLDVQVLWSTLNSVLGVLLNDVVYLVIDNFTMKHSEGEELMKLVSDTTPHGIGRKGLIKLIMTSVYSPRCISRRGTIISALVMDPVTMQHDIQCFMTAVLKGERESVVTERNYDGILEDCHGTFAYAVAAREYLARKSTIDGVTGRLPTWLWGVFDELMAPNIEDSRCQQVLRIIAVAARPLRVKELECILGALGAGDCECNDSKSFCLATAIPHACIPFLKVSAGCIHFSHPKLRNYMAHSNRLGESETHGILAEKCIEFACTEDKCSSSEAEQEGAQYLNLSARDPFLQYAVRYWSHHLLLSCSEASSRHTATSLGAKIKNIAWMEKAQGDLIQSTQEMESYLRDNLEAQRRMGFRLKDIMKSIVEVASVANMRGDVLYSIELLSSVSEDTQFKTASIEEQYHILSTLGRCYSRASQWQNAERYCRQSIDLYNAYPEKEVREMIRTQNCLGWIIRAQNRLVDASRIFMRSYVASKQRLGLDDDETILALTQTVHLYEQRGKCGVPMKLLLLHLWASALDHGVEHRSITRTLSIIIELANQRERSHEAENTCLKLLEASKLRHRPNVSLGIVLAGLYGRQSKWFEATELLSTLAHHPEIYNRADLAFRVLVNLADAQMANGSWVQALTTLSTCTPSVLSREDNQQLQTKRARCEEALGRSENAEKILREMLDEEKKIGQWRTRTVFNIGEELTAFYERQNVLEMALEVYQEIYHGYITALGQNHRYAIATNTAIADLLERRLEWTKAQHKQQDIAAITVASRGISHHRVKQAQRKSLIAGLHAIVA